jgi:hypothetical protein
MSLQQLFTVLDKYEFKKNHNSNLFRKQGQGMTPEEVQQCIGFFSENIKMSEPPSTMTRLGRKIEAM